MGAGVPVSTDVDRAERERQSSPGKPPPSQECAGKLAGYDGHVVSRLEQWLQHQIARRLERDIARRSTRGQLEFDQLLHARRRIGLDMVRSGELEQTLLARR